MNTTLSERIPLQALPADDDGFRALPMGIARVRDRVIVSVNPRFCEMTGYAPEELVDRPTAMVYASEEDYRRMGETFYADQRGIPDLREAIARYMTRVYGAKPGGGAFAPDRFFVTVGGMHALEIAAKMTVAAGEEALIPSPAWPNFAGAIRLAGAKPVFVPLERGETRWRLDPDRLAAAVTPATRVIFVNSPANPTGFVATREELAAALAIARRHNLWIVADEIYGRLTFSGVRAPSSHDPYHHY